MFFKLSHESQQEVTTLFETAEPLIDQEINPSHESQQEVATLFETAEPLIDQEINLDSLKAYLHNNFPERTHSDSMVVSELVRELLEAGYTSIGDIERAVWTAWDAFVLFEKEKRPLQSEKKYSDVGIIRSLFRLIDDKFPGSHALQNYKKLLKK
jgi:hypothetical protein